MKLYTVVVVEAGVVTSVETFTEYAEADRVRADTARHVGRDGDVTLHETTVDGDGETEAEAGTGS